MASKGNKKDIEDDVDIEDEEDEEDDDEEQGDEEQGDEEKERKLEDIRNPDVVTKYKLGAEIAHGALQLVIKECKVGAKVLELCKLGDKFIVDACAKIYNKGKVTKGIGFPTCISINNVVSSFSPLNGDTTEIAAGDVVKIALGVEVDGYVSQVAHTIVLDDAQITGRKADVIMAAYTAAECAYRLLKPGTKNSEFTEMFEKVAKSYKVNTIQGVFSHQVERYTIDGEKKIENHKPEVALSGDAKTKECTIEVNEVWSIDAVVSTGSGKPTEIGEKTTVYKRFDNQYSLKMKASRAVLSEIDNRFPRFPFTMRALEVDEKKVKFGISECAKHQLVEPYPVLAEKAGEIVAHFQFTGLVLPNGTMKITGLPIDLSKVKSEQVLDDQVKALLAQPVWSKKKAKNKKKKSKKKKPAAAGAAAPAPAAAAAPAK